MIDDLVDAMRHVGVGYNMRVTCPACGEYEANAKRAEDGILWHCFRASCGARGLIPQTPIFGRSPAPPPAFVPLPYPYQDDLNTAAGGWFWSLNRDEVVFPITAFDGAELGHISRTNLDGKKTVRTWRVVDRAFYHFARPLNFLFAPTGLWLVEDWRSAEKLSGRGRHAVALLGTAATERFIDEELRPAARRFGWTQILVALDPGAEAAALALRDRLRYGHNFDTLVVPLEKDIKDMSDARLDTLTAYYDPIP